MEDDKSVRERAGGERQGEREEKVVRQNEWMEKNKSGVRSGAFFEGGRSPIRHDAGKCF